MMTRKQFEAVAALIADKKDFGNGTIDYDAGMERMRLLVAEDLADYFADENPNFDRKRFLTACSGGY